MVRYRLSAAAQADVQAMLGWTDAQFGESARARYASLLIAALRDVAAQPDRPGSQERPELGPGVRTWHLRLSRNPLTSSLDRVRRPRHFLVYRTEPGLVLVARVLHDAMELARHLDPDASLA